MLRGLALIEFVTYIGPWILFAFICLIGMMVLGERADIAKNKLAEKEKEISYLKRRVQHYKGLLTIREANKYHENTQEEVTK